MRDHDGALAHRAPAPSWFDERELAAEAASLPRSVSQVPESSGKGWEPPHRSKPLSKNVTIPLAYRS